jgi:hypothetical protein
MEKFGSRTRDKPSGSAIVLKKMVGKGQVCLVCVGTPDKSESRPPPVLIIHKKGESQSLCYYHRQIFQTCSFMLCSTKSSGVRLKALSSEMDEV